MRKDYRRQLIAAAVALVLAALVLAFFGAGAWVLSLLVLALAYAGAYHGLLDWDARNRVADSDRL